MIYQTVDGEALFRASRKLPCHIKQVFWDRDLGKVLLRENSLPGASDRYCASALFELNISNGVVTKLKTELEPLHNGGSAWSTARATDWCACQLGDNPGVWVEINSIKQFISVPEIRNHHPTMTWYGTGMLWSMQWSRSGDCAVAELGEPLGRSMLVITHSGSQIASSLITAGSDDIDGEREYLCAVSDDGGYVLSYEVIGTVDDSRSYRWILYRKKVMAETESTSLYE